MFSIIGDDKLSHLDSQISKLISIYLVIYPRYYCLQMDDSDLKRDTLHRLLTLYPNGLLEKGWDIAKLSGNSSLPFCYVKDNLHLSWNWIKIINNCEDMEYQDLMNHKSYWIGSEDLWNELMWSRHLCEDLIEFFIAEADPREVNIDDIWITISKNWFLTKELMIKYMDKLHWPSITYDSHEIDMEFIEQFHDFFYIEYPKKYHGSFIYPLMKNSFINLPIEGEDDFNQGDLYTSRKIDLQLINKHYKKLNPSCWDIISYRSDWIDNSEECMDFIYHHFDRLNWNGLSKSLLPYPEIVKRFPNFINWSIFGDSNDWTPNDLEEYRDRLGEDRFISLAIDKCLSQVDVKIISTWKLSKVHWDLLSKNQNITSEILEEFKDTLNYKILSGNSSVPYEFILSSPKRSWDNSELSKRTYLPSIRGLMTKSANKK